MIKCSFFLFSSLSIPATDGIFADNGSNFWSSVQFSREKIFLASNFHVTGLNGPLFLAKVHAAQKKRLSRIFVILSI